MAGANRPGHQRSAVVFIQKRGTRHDTVLRASRYTIAAR